MQNIAQKCLQINTEIRNEQIFVKLNKAASVSTKHYDSDQLSKVKCIIKLATRIQVQTPSYVGWLLFFWSPYESEYNCDGFG